MKDSTFIKRYAEKNPEPDQKYCPELRIYWRGRQNGISYLKEYNPKNGIVKIGNQTWDRYYNVHYLSARSYNAYGIYAKQIRNGDVLEIAFVKMENMKRGKDGEIRLWKFTNHQYYFDRVFVTKDATVYNPDGTLYSPEHNGKYYNKQFIKGAMEMTHQGYVSSTNVLNELKSFVNVNQQNFYMWHFIKHYKNLKPRNINSKPNPVLSLELEPITRIFQPIYFQVLSEDYSVFRIFSTDNYRNDNREVYRVFINKKGKVTILEKNRYSNNSWRVTSSPSVHSYYLSRDNVREKNIYAENIKEFPALKYIADIAVGETDIKTINNIIKMLRHPIIELLCKSGYQKLAKYVSRNDTVKANIRDMLGVELKTEKGSVTKLLGVSKFLLKKMDNEITHEYNHYYLRNCPIGIMREYFEEKLNNLNENDVETYYNIFEKFEQQYGNPSYYLDPNSARSYWYYGHTTPRLITEENKAYMYKLIPKLAKLGPTSAGAFMDTMDVYKQLINRPEIDWLDFKKEEDIVRLHDNLVALLNTEREMQRQNRNALLQEVFEKKQEKRIKKFEDTISNDTFEIIVPKNLTEITTEGQQLSHCVGGYLERHAKGETNILFLRRKEFPSTPFYTVEVDNNDYIVQIHGKFNRWLGNDPDAISFVYKWLKERELRCEDYKLLDTASGYGKSGQEVSRSYLTA